MRLYLAEARSRSNIEVYELLALFVPLPPVCYDSGEAAQLSCARLGLQRLLVRGRRGWSEQRRCPGREYEA